MNIAAPNIFIRNNKYSLDSIYDNEIEANKREHELDSTYGYVLTEVRFIQCDTKYASRGYCFAVYKSNERRRKDYSNW